jgi:hypothetical protein
MIKSPLERFVMNQHITDGNRWIVKIVLFMFLLSAGASAMNSAAGHDKNLQRSEIPGQPLPPPPPPPPALR